MRHGAGRRLGAAAMAVGAVLAASWSLVPAAHATVTPVPPADRQGKVLVLRPHMVQLALDGVVRRVVPLPDGPVTLAQVAAAVADPSYVKATGATITLSASLDQRPGTTLLVGAPTARLILVGSALTGAGATVRFDGVRVRASSAGGSRAPVVSYSGGSTVTVTDSSFTGLGRSTGTRAMRGFYVGRQSTLIARTATFAHGVAGLIADRASSVSLTGVTATANSGTGIDLRDDVTVELDGVLATSNRQDGISLDGASSLWRLGTLRAEGNASTGVRLRHSNHATATSVIARANGEHGLRLDECVSCTVGTATVSGSPTGVSVARSQDVTVKALTASSVGIGLAVDAATERLAVEDGRVTGASDIGYRVAGRGVRLTGSATTGSTTGVVVSSTADDVRLERLRVAGGDTGVQVNAGARSVLISSVDVTGASTTGLSLGASDVQVSHSSVSGSPVGVWIYGDSAGVVLDTVSVTSATTGLLSTAGTGDLTARHLTVTGASSVGVNSSAAHLDLSDSAIGADATGLELRSSTAVTSTTVDAKNRGVHVFEGTSATITDSRITADEVGVDASAGSDVLLDSTDVTAADAIRGKVQVEGQTHVSPLPLHWLGIAGISAVVLALLLEGVRRLREDVRHRTVSAPEHVTNRA